MKKKYLFLSAIILISLSVNAGSLCHIFFEKKKPIESVESEYKKIVAPQKDTLRITELHNRVFFPMVERLSNLVRNTPESEIKNSASLVLKKFPILEYNSQEIQGLHQAEIKLIGNAAFKYLDAYASIYKSNSEYRENFLQSPAVGLVHKPNREREKQLGKLHGWFSMNVTRVGGYGRRFAEDTMLTTQILTDIATKYLASTSREIYEKNPSLIQKETARGIMAPYEHADLKMAPLSSLSEGIMSFHQLLTTVLADKISGYETGSQALEAFIFNGSDDGGLTSALVKKYSLGIVGPMANDGLAFQHPFVKNSDGKLEISNNLKELLIRHTDHASKYKRRRVCPMAFLFKGKREKDDVKTGLQLIAEAYWKIYQVVSKRDD